MERSEKILFVPADAGHVDEMYEIEKEVFSTPWSHESLLKDVCSHEIAVYIVGTVKEHVVSYAGFWFVLDEAHITNVAVKPGYRRMGIGDTMMRRVLDIAWAKGIATISLEVRASNTPALNLYKKLGFIQCGLRKGYYPDTGEDAVLMTRLNLKDE